MGQLYLIIPKRMRKVHSLWIRFSVSTQLFPYLLYLLKTTLYHQLGFWKVSPVLNKNKRKEKKARKWLYYSAPFYTGVRKTYEDHLKETSITYWMQIKLRAFSAIVWTWARSDTSVATVQKDLTAFDTTRPDIYIYIYIFIHATGKNLL